MGINLEFAQRVIDAYFEHYDLYGGKEGQAAHHLRDCIVAELDAQQPAPSAEGVTDAMVEAACTAIGDQPGWQSFIDWMTEDRNELRSIMRTAITAAIANAKEKS